MGQEAVFLEQVREGLRQAGIDLGLPLVVAVSGGPDSLALLEALLGIWEGEGPVIAAYFNHRLRGYYSEGDARFVADYCRERGVRITTGTGDVKAFKAESGLSLEDAARRMRYQFLAHTVHQHRAQGVATGHTMDDQAESVLLHIVRGSGLRGLAGMNSRSHLRFEGSQEDVTVLRPLLAVRRSQTQAFCEARVLRPRQDASNTDLAHPRNRIRSTVIPELVAINPQVVPALHRLSGALAEDVAWIDTQVSEALEVAQVHEVRPGVVQALRGKLLALPRPLQVRCLRALYLRVSGDVEALEAVHLAQLQNILSGASGRAIDLPYGVRARIDYDAVVFTGAASNTKRDGDGACLYPPPFEAKRLAVPGITSLCQGWSLYIEQVSGALATTCVAHEKGDDATDQGSFTISEAPHSELDERGAPGRHAAGTAYSAVLDADAVGDSLIVRTRKPGDRFQPLGMSSAKKLQDFFVDDRVPRRWRDRVPLVVGRRGIAWVAGSRPADWAKLNAKSTRCFCLQLRRTTI